MLQGKRKAATAEDLLRARYSAFARSEIDFILKSHHPETREQVKREEIEEWSKSSEWLGLKVLQKQAGETTDEEGTVTFHARYIGADGKPDGKEPGKIEDHYEHATFKKSEGNWMFFDAQGLRQGPIRRTEPKTGRNDPCPCGSGKKYKKCHAQAEAG